MNRIVFVAALALVACGGTHSALSSNNAGTGTSTLQITADVQASLTSGGPVTSFSVRIQDGLGNNVSGATVTINNPDFGAVPLVEANAGSGHYTNSKAAFSGGDFRLDVDRNTDNVHGVVVGGPGTSDITAPKSNTTYAANPQALQLSWTTPSQAKAANIHTRDFDADVPDTGAYSIPAASNPPRSSQLLTISRYNEVDIAGALSGSRMRVTSSTTVSPFVVQ